MTFRVVRSARSRARLKRGFFRRHPDWPGRRAHEARQILYQAGTCTPHRTPCFLGAMGVLLHVFTICRHWSRLPRRPCVASTRGEPCNGLRLIMPAEHTIAVGPLRKPTFAEISSSTDASCAVPRSWCLFIGVARIQCVKPSSSCLVLPCNDTKVQYSNHIIHVRTFQESASTAVAQRSVILRGCVVILGGLATVRVTLLRSVCSCRFV